MEINGFNEQFARPSLHRKVVSDIASSAVQIFKIFRGGPP